MEQSTTTTPEVIAERKGQARPSLKKKVLIILVSVLITLLVIELIARLVLGNGTESFLRQKLTLIQKAHPVVYDAQLGWLPKPNYSDDENLWGTRVTITNEGFRSNGNGGSTDRPVKILAVGDSFTFGAEVSDDETWPAHLQRLLRTEVINGGVFAYGLDQIILRTRDLVPSEKPDWVILSFIPSDVGRCGLDIKDGAAKPYFVLVDGKLEIRNQPVPLPGRPMDPFRRVFGYSWIVHS
ncbi:MAG TPA: hypothetical protein VG778_11275, partial [Blastocatellia bacterium]|nr:hypothetical protein [Blastocatellia bacterium]